MGREIKFRAFEPDSKEMVHFDNSLAARDMYQAKHYSAMTGKKAGIVLIIEKPEHKKYYDRVKNLIEYHALPIDLFTVTP